MSTYCKMPTDIVLTADSVATLIAGLGEYDREMTWVLTFTGDNHFIDKHLISAGGFTKAYVDFKILFKRILNDNASQYLLVHNHPNQSCKPSKADIDLTASVDQVSKLLDLTLIEHMVIGMDNKIGLVRKYAQEHMED